MIEKVITELTLTPTPKLLFGGKQPIARLKNCIKGAANLNAYRFYKLDSAAEAYEYWSIPHLTDGQKRDFLQFMAII